MRKQYPVVLLGYAGETTCPESHGRSRSHMNSNILMFHSVHTPSGLVFLMTHFTPDLFCCLQPLPAASYALCCLQCVPHRGHVSKSWWSSLLHAKEEAALCSAALQGGQFSSSAKSAKVRIRITRFQEKFRPFLQAGVTSQ